MPGPINNEAGSRRSSVSESTQSATQAADQAPRRLSEAEFNQELDNYVNNGPAEEHDGRAVIAQKIREAYADRNMDAIYFFGSSVRGNITALPNVLGELEHITTLSVGLRGLTTLSSLTRPMPNVKVLLLDPYDLTALPDNFAELFPNLEYLSCNMASNLVVSAQQLASLHHLEMLSVDDRANNIPALLNELPSLRALIDNDGYSTPESIAAYNQRRYGRQDSDELFVRSASPRRYAPINLNRFEFLNESTTLSSRSINLPSNIKSKLDLIVPNEVEATQLEKSFVTYIKKIVEECVPKYLAEENVVDVLDTVLRNINDLRNQVFKLAQEGIDNCADNRIKTFNEMQLHAKIATVSADTALTDKTKALFDLFKGLYRQELLAGFTEQIMLERWAIKNPGQFKDGVPVDNKGQKTAPHLKEALEVELGLRYLLKDKLQLAFPVREMKYLRLAEEYMSDSLSDLEADFTVSEKAAIKTQEAELFVLQQEKDKDAFVLWLTSQPAWLAFLKQGNEAELQGINEANQQALENERPDIKDENFYDLPQEEQNSKLIEYQTILKQREEQQQLDFYKQKTEIILQGYLAE